MCGHWRPRSDWELYSHARTSGDDEVRQRFGGCRTPIGPAYDTIQPQFDCRDSRDIHVVGELG